MLTFCGWTPRATAKEGETHDAPGVSVLSGGSARAQGCFRVNDATTKGGVCFFSRLGTVFPEVLGQEAYFPNLKDRTSWGKINSSSSAPGKKRKRKFSRAENQVTREQPKKFSSAGDMCIHCEGSKGEENAIRVCKGKVVIPGYRSCAEGSKF